MHVFGIDVGGSGIKGAIVDVVSGKLITERKRLPTPPGAKPEEVAKVINDLLKMHGWTGPVGVGFPSVVISGVIHTAANIDSGWIGINGETYLHEVTGCPVYALNDADAAGLAEMNFGSGREYQKGVVWVGNFYKWCFVAQYRVWSSDYPRERCGKESLCCGSRYEKVVVQAICEKITGIFK